MSKDSETPPPPGGQFLVYQTQDGNLKIDAPCAVDAAFEQATKDLKKLQKPGKPNP